MLEKRRKKWKDLKQRCKCPNNTLFIMALVSLIVFLLFELVFRIYTLYLHLPWVDIPSHLLGGIMLGFVIFWVVSLTRIRHKHYVTLAYVFIASLVWEALETLEEIVIVNPPYLKDVFFWDGFTDVIVTTFGGIVALLILQNFKESKIFEHIHYH